MLRTRGVSLTTNWSIHPHWLTFVDVDCTRFAAHSKFSNFREVTDLYINAILGLGSPHPTAYCSYDRVVCYDLFRRSIEIVFWLGGKLNMWIRAWLVILILCVYRNFRYTTKYVKVVLRLLLLLCLYVYDAWLRNQKTVVNGFRKQLGPAVFAVLSLSSLSGQ